jgi:hypothetical protein
VPAAAVIPIPIAYIKFVVVEVFVVYFGGLPHWKVLYCAFRITLKKLECSKQTLSEQSSIG